jgi:hypothetical protein
MASSWRPTPIGLRGLPQGRCPTTTRNATRRSQGPAAWSHGACAPDGGHSTWAGGFQRRLKESIGAGSGHTTILPCEAAGGAFQNPRVRLRETSDPQSRRERQAACRNTIAADGQPSRHGRRLPHPRGYLRPSAPSADEGVDPQMAQMDADSRECRTTGFQGFHPFDMQSASKTRDLPRRGHGPIEPCAQIRDGSRGLCVNRGWGPVPAQELRGAFLCDCQTDRSGLVASKMNLFTQGLARG